MYPLAAQKLSCAHRRRWAPLLVAATLAAATVARADNDLDLPNPPTNIETIAAGSLVIPMDTNSQSLVSPFNLKAYGLAYALLNTNVVLKWSIAAGKAKDGVDFSGYAMRIKPTTNVAANVSFRAGPFIIPSEYTNRAAATINAWSNSVAVYKLLSNTTADIRYTLSHRPRLAVLNDGNNQDIQVAMLDEAGIDVNTIIVTNVAALNSNSCFTCVSEAHMQSTASTGQVAALLAFVRSGGNFIAQCKGIDAYENASNGVFQTTKGVSVGNGGESFVYPSPDLAFNQFQGELERPGGAAQDWFLNSGSDLTNSAHVQVKEITSTNRMTVTVGKLVTNNFGSLVLYLGGHQFNKTTLESYNGRRVYLNGFFMSARRPVACGLNFGSDVAITKNDSVVSVIPGQSTNIYVITVTNIGPDAVTNVTITDTFPPGLTSMTWTCTALFGASVTNSSGTGNINMQANFPRGGCLSFTATAAAVFSGDLCAITNIATATVPSTTIDPVPGNNSATDVDSITIGSFRGQVRDDIDGNGNLADADPGLTNVTLRLWTDPNGDGNPSDGTIVSTRVTDVSGYYSFTNVAGGSYVIQEIDRTNYASTADTYGSNDNYIVAAANCGTFTTSANNDFIDSKMADIFGHVHNDTDGDGDTNDVESGISGVTLYLWSDPNGDGITGDGVILMTNVTDWAGDTTFPLLMPGRYIIVENDAPGFTSTGDSKGANDNSVSMLLPGGLDFDAYFLDWSSTGLNIVKTCDQTNDLDVGDVVTYSIMVTNYRNSTQTSVTIKDPLPTELSYRTNSTWIVASSGYAHDQFGSVSYTNSGGTINWATNWVDENDDGSPSAGNVRVELASLHLKGANSGARRGVNISGNQLATLTMSYDVQSLDNTNDFITLQIGTHTSSWVQLNRWTGPIVSQTGTVTYDISSYIGTNTMIHFTNSASMSTDDHGYFDNIRIDVKTSKAGGSPTTIAQDYTMYPGSSMMITFTAEVVDVATIVNQACVTTAVESNGLCASVANDVLEIAMTQGVRFVKSGTNGCHLGWTTSTGQITKTYDLIYVDTASPGFTSALTSMWASAGTVSDSHYLDTGSVSRMPPTSLTNQMRFYRIARQGKWSANLNPRHASKEIYVAKNVQLQPGENWVKLFMIPDENSVAKIFGTNALPAGSQMSQATVIEWYGATKNGKATNTIWLSTAGTWMNATGGVANNQSVPLNEGFNVVIPNGAGARNMLVIGRVPTNASAANGHVVTLVGSNTYNIVSYNFPYKVKLKDTGLKQAGIKGPSAGGANPNNSDEIRILQRGGGSFASPKARILVSSSNTFVYWTGGTQGSSAENVLLDVDDALIVYTRKTMTNLTWSPSLPYVAPTINMTP